MTISMPETAPTRAAMVRAYRDALLALVEDATRTVTELNEATNEAGVLAVAATGDLDAAAAVEAAIGNVPVLTRRDVDEAIAAVWAQAIPMPEETSAEVRTPASVVVWAICPRCSIAQAILVTIKPELLVSDEGSELRVKAKAKGRSHLCGQLPLPVAADGQESLGFDETPSCLEPVDGPDQPDDAVCLLPKGHDGDHDPLFVEAEAEDVLEPQPELVEA